ncbi:probable plastid-lipid-associated protein 12, chloroplastic isoform X3 [Trifolium pratense]|uniref:probable plastid-lipid-associated protein 12, chloroplastic isoform X3 n=1 Tax=Trifolium pratense TaxID=57577 RepID=UPI001E69201A|nr:probable plastid-lipid-associated protein 12, chloroplastic isoform X3 [Trifolium pratense]
MALTLRVVNVNNNIGFHSSFSRSTFVSPNPSKSSSREYNSFVFQCSQVEQLSVTESENSLIEALIGIQGRGRSTSPQQLNSIERAIQVLESLGGGVPDPAAASIGDGKRILFRFDRAAFSFKFLPFKVPYPVPFKLLGDEAKGWLDTTYLSHSGNLRISRGNKGTTFVLQKQTEPKQKLLTAISSGVGVREEIDKLISLNKNSGEEPELEEGEWQMIWNSQTVTDSWLENAANGLMGKQIVGKNGGIKYVVDILLGLKFSMTGTFVKSAPKVYEVTMDDAAIIGGPFGYPLEFGKKFILEILFSDNKVRISRGDNGIIFVHSRTNALR